MRLVGTEELSALAAGSDAHVAVVWTGNGPTDQALRNYLSLSASPQSFVSNGYSHEEVFWSRYFWFRVHTTRRVLLLGPDAGLEQQAARILDAPFPLCHPDWKNLEIVEKAATREASGVPGH